MPYSKYTLNDIMRLIQGYTSIYLTFNNALKDFAEKLKFGAVASYPIRVRRRLFKDGSNYHFCNEFGQTSSDREDELI